MERGLLKWQTKVSNLVQVFPLAFKGEHQLSSEGATVQVIKEQSEAYSHMREGLPFRTRGHSLPWKLSEGRDPTTSRYIKPQPIKRKCN